MSVEPRNPRKAARRAAKQATGHKPMSPGKAAAAGGAGGAVIVVLDEAGVGVVNVIAGTETWAGVRMMVQADLAANATVLGLALAAATLAAGRGVWRLGRAVWRKIVPDRDGDGRRTLAEIVDG